MDAYDYAFYFYRPDIQRMIREKYGSIDNFVKQLIREILSR